MPTANWEGQLREDRHSARQESDRELKKELTSTIRDVVSKGSKIEAIKHGLKIGLMLRQQASDMRWDGLSFWFILFICMIKDFLDIITLSGIGWITTWVITPILFMFFFLRRSFFKRWLIRRYLGKWIIIIIAGFFPGTSIFPGYTIGALMMKHSINKKINKLKTEVKDVDSSINQLQNSRD